MFTCLSRSCMQLSKWPVGWHTFPWLAMPSQCLPVLSPHQCETSDQLVTAPSTIAISPSQQITRKALRPSQLRARDGMDQKGPSDPGCDMPRAFSAVDV